MPSFDDEFSDSFDQRNAAVSARVEKAEDLELSKYFSFCLILGNRLWLRLADDQASGS
jgi:hypothetical protein